MRRTDLTGQKFGKLVAVKCLHPSKYGPIWECVCDCGNKTEVLAGNLRNNNTKSCGCIWRKPRHGHSLRGQKSPEYSSYLHAKTRCNNPNFKQWKDYGGRGIEFRFDSFEDFYAEVGPWIQGTTIERMNNDGHYEKGNVRWATRKEQQSNRRNSPKVLCLQ